MGQSYRCYISVSAIIVIEKLTARPRRRITRFSSPTSCTLPYLFRKFSVIMMISTKRQVSHQGRYAVSCIDNPSTE